MKITRVLTYNVSEDYVRNFFDENWWGDNEYVGEYDFDVFIDILRDEGYDDEEIIYEKGAKERITQIWQEEYDNYHRQTDEEKRKKSEKEILEDIQYYKAKIAFLEDKVKSMRGE